MTDAGGPEAILKEKAELPSGLKDDTAVGSVHEVINASGHRDQLDRQYGILSICGMALTVDNAWVAIGTSMNVAICEFPCFIKSQPAELIHLFP